MEELTHFKKLFAVNCNDKTEKKDNGSTQLTYLSWCYAWSEVKKEYPDANYEILKFGENKLPYVYDEKTGYMVFTRVEIEGVEHEMWLPVMDSANKAMKDKPYTYKVKEYQNRKWTGQYIDKYVMPATMFDINKTIMRCLTKNLAMFGLGLYIYAGEDLPESTTDVYGITESGVPIGEPTSSKKKTVKTNKVVMIQDTQKEMIKNRFTADEIKAYLEEINKPKLSALTVVEASNLLLRKAGNENE